MSREIQMLLIEDEPVDVMTARRALRQRNLNVSLHVVESAEAALDWLEISAATRSEPRVRPDLILADLRLPRLSGLDLLERVKADAFLRRVPFVILSTSAHDAEVSRAYELGVAGYFVKPVAFEEYADRIAATVTFCALGQQSDSLPAEVEAAATSSGRHYLEDELRNLLHGDESVFDFIEREASGGIWFRNLENPEHEWMSEGFWRSFGYDPQEKPHLTASWRDMIDPDDLAVAVANLEKHCADPTHPYDQIIRYRHRDGSTVSVHCRGFAIRDSDGQPIRLFGVHTDVTDAARETDRSDALAERLRTIHELVTGLDARGSMNPGEINLLVARIRSAAAER